MLIKRKSDNKKKILLAVLAAITTPWLVIGAIKGFKVVYGLVKSLPGWEQTAIWISLISIISILVGYLLFTALRRLALRNMHVRNNKPRQLGVRLFGGGFADVIDKIHTDKELKFKAAGFAFIPRSMKGDAMVSICEDPFPCQGFPIREAVRSFSGAVAQRNVEEPPAARAYNEWTGQHRELVFLMDIFGKGQGFTGISCLHTWNWLAKPDVFRFLVVVFEPEEARKEGNASEGIPNMENSEKEAEECLS